MLEKDAGGEILGGLAGLLARPFAGAAGSAAVRNKVVGGLTRHVNDPLERLLHRIGAGKAVEGVARAAAVPIPKSWPLLGRLAEKSIKIPDGVPLIGGHGSIPYMPTSEARATWAADKAKSTINTIAQHPDAAAFSAATSLMAPIPGITEAYLGAKGLATKGLEKLTSTPRIAPGFHEARGPLPAEPTYLKHPPSDTKIGFAYVVGRNAALEKFAIRLV